MLTAVSLVSHALNSAHSADSALLGAKPSKLQHLRLCSVLVSLCSWRVSRPGRVSQVNGPLALQLHGRGVALCLFNTTGYREKSLPI